MLELMSEAHYDLKPEVWQPKVISCQVYWQLMHISHTHTYIYIYTYIHTYIHIYILFRAVVSITALSVRTISLVENYVAVDVRVDVTDWSREQIWEQMVS